MTFQHLLIETVPIMRLCSVMDEFFCEHLRGSIVFENNTTEEGFATISIEGLAKFYKRLAAMLFGESTLRIHSSSENLYCKMVTEWEPCRKIGERERAELSALAKEGGFEVRFAPGEYTEKLAVLIELKPMKYLSIYATSFDVIRDAFYRVFVLYELHNKNKG
ncbi:MAG: hypothetical protein J6V09_00815 [Clostridia bacterium]|nr:hypothetical protein [Clostridia bacterium]